MHLRSLFTKIGDPFPKGAVALLLILQTSSTFGLSEIDLFSANTDGYHTYRIPSLIVTTNGTLLAFCEGRKNSRSDSGDVDIVLKRSTDGGKTWGAQRIIWDDGPNTCGNPCPVVDNNTGTIWLLLTHNRGEDTEKEILNGTARGTRTVWLMGSIDDGLTWSEPVEITNSVKDPSWGWYATGPGVGIQIAHGPHRGRLIIPADHSYRDSVEGNGAGEGAIEYGAHSIHSDDGGKSWQLGGTIRPKMNECQVVELADGKGTLLMNMRSYFGRSRRAQSVSQDGGQSWSAPADHPELIEPVCQASILRYTWPGENGKSRILFSNPADEKRRRNMTVRLSYDEAKTWPVAKSINAEWSAYSCLAVLPDNTIACLYERGEKHASEKITLSRFTLEWLTGGKDRVSN